MSKILIAVIAVLLASCSVVKQAECKTKYITVTVITDYGTSQMQVPYCDTIYLRKKQPDSIAIQYKVK